ncbi:hypothetical protein [Haloarchaeobius sp. DFWS5]|uniref:hypothetical protein n=1 Tax=Haloarchaeobius sp. DFWS5 TaxID=3446114 RepID=UPI003EBE9B11
MKRRAILASVAGLGAMAGCLGDTGGGDSTTGTTRTPTGTTQQSPDTATATDRPTESPDSETETTTQPEDESGTTEDDGEPEDDFEWDPASDDPFKTFDFGDRSAVAFPDNNRPLTVRIWNMADEERKISFDVDDTGSAAVQGYKIPFPPNEWMELSILVPSTYTLAVSTDDESEDRVQYDHGDFDCNETVSFVGIDAENRVRQKTQTTLVECPDPTVTTTDLTDGDGACASETRSSASVTFGDETVTVDGEFQTGDPCYDLELADANYDAKTDELVLTVAASDTGDECIECVGLVPYEAAVGFKYDFPTHVAVQHQQQGETTTVARATRNAAD